MAVRPTLASLEASSVEIMNAVRASIGGNYLNDVPVAIDTTESIHAIGDVIMAYQPYQNAFLNALVNRIGMTVITSKMYQNPWSVFKKGMLEFGETVEELFVNIAKPHTYDPSGAENDLYKRVMPDVRAAFHTMNYKKFYKVTVSQDQLKQAFLSWNGVSDLLSSIVNSLYTAANYDEYVVMKYMLCRAALNGEIYSQTTSAPTDANAKTIVKDVKTKSGELVFMTKKHNISGVTTKTEKSEQYLIFPVATESLMDVEVLAAAFNMDKVEFMGHIVSVDSFSEHDTDRLEELFGDDRIYSAFTAGEITKLESMVGILLDKDFWFTYDNMVNFTELFNGEGLYWNYWYHNWKTFSVSPFANAVVFSSVAAAVTSVTVSPKTVTLEVGQNGLFEATVAGTGFYDQNVIWEIDDAPTSTGTYLVGGKLHIAADETATTIVITAKSLADGTKTDTATVTVNVPV